MDSLLQNGDLLFVAGRREHINRFEHESGL